jgi:YD repeat-containing protein
VLSQTFNTDGTEAARTDFETGTSAFAYDSLRHVSAVTNADGSIRRFVYDALDRVVSLTDERTNTFLFSYDPNGNLSTITDPAGGVTRLVYDAMDRLMQHVDRTGASSTRRAC